MKLLATALLLAGSLAFAQCRDKGKHIVPENAQDRVPTAVPQPKPAASGFVGNKDSKTLHRAGCKMAAKLKAENKATFATKAEAEKAGYKACKVCKP